MKNILMWLEHTAAQQPEKIAFLDQQNAITFSELEQRAKSIGSALAREELSDAPIPVFSGRNVYTPSLYLGVVYSGHAYVPIDAKLPPMRIQKILDQLEPSVILTDDENYETVKKCAQGTRILTAGELAKAGTDQARLDEIRGNMVETDPLYVIYTSGSTGNPKGVVTSHRSLICYLSAYEKVMEITGEDRLGNQSPLDYIAAVRDIYLPLKCGCSTVIIPKEYFMEPNRLFSYMNENQVTAVGWCVSAFTIALTLGAFEETTLTTLKKICFSGAVMPGRCLRVWQKNLPAARFVNQYGPTEATASCTYYVVDHLVEEKEVLPIGKAYENYRVFVLNERGEEAKDGELGEICVSGPALALGYYRDPVRTQAAFVQRPGNGSYGERMYRTGDIGLRRPDGILEFHGRKDRQIKHMGHRVELDEIELAANQIPQIRESCCIYRKDQEKLYLFYQGNMGKRELLVQLRQVLPGFMVPRKVQQLERIPRLPNGKTDMNQLEKEINR